MEFTAGSEMVERTTVLVTGAAGGVGTHVVRQLLKAGYLVRATDLPQRDFAFAGSRVTIVPGNLTDRRFVKDLPRGAEYIIHAAAVTDARLPWPDIEAVNVDATRRLWDAATAHGISRFVYLSSGSIYRGSDELLDESAPQEPFGNYERSKLLAEKALLRGKFAGDPMELAILRTAWVIGPFATALMASVATVPPLFKHFLGFALKARGGPRSNMVHSLDVARAAIHFMTNGEDGGIYNIANDDQLVFADYFNIACREYGLAVIPGLPLWFPSTKALSLLGKLGTRPEPVEFLNSVGKTLWARLRKQHDLSGELRPSIDVAAVHHGATNLVLDTTRAKAAGFECLFPDYRSAIRDVLERYQKVRWIP